jgi:hypothetical protein
MAMYCMCEASNDKPDSQAFMAPNRYCAAETGDDFPPLHLHTPMRCIKIGAQQVILDVHQPNDWSGGSRPTRYHKHHPNVDVFECPNCHARIVREER